MNILIIDTATPLEVVIACKGQKVYSTTIDTSASHSLSLIDSISRCMKELHLSIHDLDYISVGIGPGSFTGIRIAVTTVRMLAQQLEIPIIPFPSQLIFAASIEASVDENLIIAFDAKKKRVFGALYKKDGNIIPKVVIPPGDYPIEKLLQKITNNKKTYVAGDGASLYEDLIAEQLSQYEILPRITPHPERSSKVIQELLREKDYKSENYNEIIPFYARKSDAEIMKGK